MIENIHWLGQSGFKITNNKVLYFDPYQIKDTTPADLILITHDHFDHCSVEDIKKIQTKDTIIVADERSAKIIGKAGTVKTVKPGETIEVSGIKIETVPSYNTNKQYHPKSNAHVGFIVTLDNQRIYHAGDTDLIPEMKNIKCDIAILPVSGTYVMTAEEAARAASQIKPKIAIPMHYGSLAGTKSDGDNFVKLCKRSGIDAKVLNQE